MTNKRGKSCGTEKLGDWRPSGVVFPQDEQFVSRTRSGGPSHAWCVGEMTIARLDNIDIILVICFSCPNADDNFDGCENNFKHDFHNASLLDFSNIVEMTSSY